MTAPTLPPCAECEGAKDDVQWYGPYNEYLCDDCKMEKIRIENNNDGFGYEYDIED